MKLTIAAIVSTIAAMFLFSGYFAITGYSCLAIAPIFGRNSHYFEVWLNRGGIRVTLAESSMPLTSLNAFYGTQHLRSHFRSRLHQPKLRESVWLFDTESNSTIETWARSFNFPIWCALFPSLIAPLLWIRRRKHRTSSGFDVITNRQP